MRKLIIGAALVMASVISPASPVEARPGGPCQVQRRPALGFARSRCQNIYPCLVQRVVVTVIHDAGNGFEYQVQYWGPRRYRDGRWSRANFPHDNDDHFASAYVRVRYRIPPEKCRALLAGS